MFRPKFSFLLLFCAVCLIGGSSFVFGQAWVAGKGTGSIAISYQNNFDDRHLFGNGADFLVINGQPNSDVGKIRLQAVFLDVGYSLTDKLALSVSLPYITAKYFAPTNPPFPGFGPHRLADGSIPIDDGQYHGGIQDLSLRVRYNIAAHPFMITPFLQYGFPSHAYQFYSHAVIGNRVAEFQIGSYAGGTLGRFLPNAYVQGGYSLGFPQRILGVSKIHHHLEFEGGYFVTERIRAFGILLGQISDGGLDLTQDLTSKALFFPDFGPPPYNAGNEKFLHHLQISRESFLDVSGGMQYSLNGGMDIYGTLVHTITARNLHALKYGLTFGVAWAWGGSPQRPCHC